MMRGVRQAIEARWYGKAGWLLLLWPLSAAFRGVAFFRRQWQVRQQPQLGAPVVVVGNITVGGTGKTPLLIALVRQLQEAGLNPGVVSRGYGVHHAAGVRKVTAESTPEDVGDEPLLIARVTQCPVAIGKDRLATAETLLRESNCDVLLSDDGLQHYRLPRDLELVVIDASRGVGNGYCLPCGPLREPLKRLREVDWVVRNGNYPCAQLESWSPVPMHMRPLNWVNVKHGQTLALDDTGWLREPAYAVAGIGNPQRFFNTLNELGLTVFTRCFPDHHAYQPADFDGFADETVLMTAKDAVKCQRFAEDNWWYLDVAAELPNGFRRAFTERVQALVSASQKLK